MGVPDSFWLPDSYNDAYRAMGDGVAVPVVQWLSQNLLIRIRSALPKSFRENKQRIYAALGPNEDEPTRSAEARAAIWDVARR